MLQVPTFEVRIKDQDLALIDLRRQARRQLLAKIGPQAFWNISINRVDGPALREQGLEPTLAKNNGRHRFRLFVNIALEGGATVGAAQVVGRSARLEVF